MHITKIELENIKSHVHFVQEFERGTTAIMGENGAGKTTLIEAIAWNLFDFLDYKKDDFLRRGEKKGVVNITFESGLDEREYRVYRDTGTGYYVFDPRLKVRVAEKKEEVARFLQQHLGVEPGTDLESLFRRAIGVPQGTFTAIFLETPAERKRAFDKLLKVEEYQEGAAKLLDTARYVDNQIAGRRENIARAEGELHRIDTLEDEFKNFSRQTEEFSSALENLTNEVETRKVVVNELDQKESRAAEVKTTLDKLTAELARAELIAQQKETDRVNAAAAAEKIKSVAADYNLHVESLGKLKELDRERDERDKLNSELQRVEAAQVNVAAEQKSVDEKLASLLRAHQEIRDLEPKAVEQEQLEKEIEKRRNDVAEGKAAENSIQRLETRLRDLRVKYSANQTQLNEATEKSVEAQFLTERQAEDARLTNDLARARAKLESDRSFQVGIENELCPILGQKCLNVKPGDTLDYVVRKQFADIETKISVLQTEKKSLTAKLEASRRAEQFLASLNNLREREKEISDEGQQIKSEKASLEKIAADLPKAAAELAELESRLKQLDNPKARIKLLQSDANNEINLRENRTTIEKNLERLENDRRILLEQLESYKFLDPQWKEFSENRDKTADAHRIYVANQDLAESLAERSKELESAAAEVSDLKQQLSAAGAEVEKASKDYDRERHQIEKGLLSENERKAAETRAYLETVRKRAEDSRKELEHLSQVRKQMQTEFKEKERLEKVAEALRFIRETLKTSAPLIAKNFVYHVSIEANQMFREISGNAERTLKWIEDYGIVLEEDGYERPFQSLSGGEQMAAALSVRLALLKQVSDIRLAFFDEPTTNMDLERRERLAEQISMITEKQTFDQLFIISHDDTFESYADYVVTLDSGTVEL